MMKRRALSLGLLALVLAGLAAGGYLWVRGRGGAVKYRTVRVERGPLTAAVSATGNLNAVITVQVGSQVSGQIQKLFVDFNSVVKRGQVIAQIDPAIFQAQVNQAKGDLDAAKAAVLNQTAAVEKARADLENARAALAQGRAMTAKAQAAMADAKRIADRNTQLFARGLIAAADRDTAQANADQAVAQYESSVANEKALGAAIQAAQAQLRVQEAALSSARAQVEQKTAALRQAQVNLDHTTITAPVDGVVVSRAVDVGQTVAASLQAPVLFTIAQDLTQMQVETSVDEADIGRILEGGPVTFTVDAFPGETFRGTITQIRKAAQIVQNVVTYTVIVGVRNPGGRLLPGMTANVKLIVAEKPSVLKIANAALRFRPPGAEPPAPAAGARGEAPAPRGGAAGGAAAARPNGQALRERLVADLKLDAAQRGKLDAILEDARQQMATLRAAEGERAAEGQKIREATRARIREILTPEQRARYDEMRPAAAGPEGRPTPGRVWVLGPDGQAKAVPVMLGLTDGNSTEIVRGDLHEGEEVVVGLAPGSRGTGGPSGGPRLRL